MNIIIASGPVIIENNKVLLNKHGDDNFWKFPGGRIDPVDYGVDFTDPLNSLETACAREVKEEMDLEIKIIKPLKPMLVPKPNSSDTQVVLIHFLAERIGEIKPGSDIKEWNWFDLNDLPPDLAPNIRPVLSSVS